MAKFVRHLIEIKNQHFVYYAQIGLVFVNLNILEDDQYWINSPDSEFYTTDDDIKDAIYNWSIICVNNC